MCVCVCVCVFSRVKNDFGSRRLWVNGTDAFDSDPARAEPILYPVFCLFFFCFVFFYRVFPFDGSGVAALARSYCVLPRFSLRPSSVQDCLVRYRALKTEPKMAELFFYTEFYLFF